MSKKIKLLERLQQRPKDFTWDEACSLMERCGFVIKSGRGSARLFEHQSTKQRVRLHEPHPANVLKRYAVDDLIEALQQAGEI